MLRFAALILLASATAAVADTSACDAVRFGSLAQAIGLRHDKIVSLAITNGNGIADFALIALPEGDPGICGIMLAANLAGTLPLECGDGPDLSKRPARNCDMALAGAPLELVVTFAPEDAVAAESRTRAVARYVADEVLCRPS